MLLDIFFIKYYFFMSLSSLSPLAKSGILLTLGLSIFGFADNLTLLVSDEVSVGQFHFSRSLLIVITLHPIFCSNDEAIFFAEPPPTSTITLGLSDTFPIICTASST